MGDELREETSEVIKFLVNFQSLKSFAHVIIDNHIFESESVESTNAGPLYFRTKFGCSMRILAFNYLVKSDKYSFPIYLGIDSGNKIGNYFLFHRNKNFLKKSLGKKFLDIQPGFSIFFERQTFNSHLFQKEENVELELLIDCLVRVPPVA